MKFSFIVIAFNEERTIAQCIDALLALESLGKGYEILVVDDGSTDHTQKIVTGLMETCPQLKLISDGKNHGRGFSRFTGVKNAQGEYICMIDADIVLPTNWLKRCLQASTHHDAVGGIAVPDGDVSYIDKLFKLKPKVAPHTTSVSGGNGFYKGSVFEKANFNPLLREGEDIDFNHQLQAHGFRTKAIPELIVRHEENKSFGTSIKWLFQSGSGATRQLMRFKKVRRPDLTTLLFYIVTITALVVSMHLHSFFWLLLIIVFLLLISTAHVYSKFDLEPIGSFVGAILINGILLASYFIGRLYGLIRWI